MSRDRVAEPQRAGQLRRELAATAPQTPNAGISTVPNPASAAQATASEAAIQRGGFRGEGEEKKGGVIRSNRTIAKSP